MEKNKCVLLTFEYFMLKHTHAAVFFNLKNCTANKMYKI